MAMKGYSRSPKAPVLKPCQFRIIPKTLVRECSPTLQQMGSQHILQTQLTGLEIFSFAEISRGIPILHNSSQSNMICLLSLNAVIVIYNHNNLWHFSFFQICCVSFWVSKSFCRICCKNPTCNITVYLNKEAQSVEAVEYADCISAEG